jgi:hypothetical protein
MMLHSLYKDFFRFIEAVKKGEDIFSAYQEHYLRPHEKFLTSYWRLFRHFDGKLIEQRVRAIKSEDYSFLESILSVEPPEEMCRKALERCFEAAETLGIKKEEIPEPDIYLFIGFFSADGFTMMLEGRPVLGFGLERYCGLKDLPIIFSHEFAHFLEKIRPGIFRTEKACREGTLGELLFSEGAAFHFSLAAYPKRKLPEHLFLRRDVLNWCMENEKRLLDIIRPELERDIEEDSIYVIERKNELPPRSLNYIAYKLTEDMF